MPRTPRLAGIVVAALLTGGVARPAAAAEEFVFHHENVMGTSLELRVRSDGAAAARRAEGRVLAEIDRLARVFSNHDPASEFRRWQAAAGAPARASAELSEVLRESDRWRELTGGAFDPRVQALARLWSACAAEGRTPTAAETAAALARMARPAWRFDPASGAAVRLGDCPLTLDGIAKGAIVEKACAAALEPAGGVVGLLLNVGGDLRVCGDLAGTVGIAAPRGDSESTAPVATIEVRDRAVSTSGDAQRGLMIGGRWYSHIFDPRTGLPAARTVSATVVAPRSADADALATALNVLTPDEGLRLVDALPGAACLIVAADGRVTRSAGWGRYERSGPGPLAFAAGPDAPAAKAKPDGKAAPWGDGYELRVDFEINRPADSGGRGYRRPYVAVWVEDRDGFPVRNLLLWVSQGGSGPFQWLPDLRRWHRADQVRKRTDATELVLTMSRPTRPPGKYSVVWNGKDDHGRPVPPGTYTLFIDAAREHGTYQTIRFPVTPADRPFTAEAPGNVEIKAASITYRRKAAPR